MLDGHQIQRLRTHGAAISPLAFEIADQFMAAIHHHHPELRMAYPMQTRAQRRALAAAMAWFVKNLAHLDEQAPVLAVFASRFAQRGLNESHARTARRALVQTLERVCGPTWNPTLNADWTSAAQAIFDALVNAAPRTHPTAKSTELKLAA